LFYKNKAAFFYLKTRKTLKRNYIYEHELPNYYFMKRITHKYIAKNQQLILTKTFYGTFLVSDIIDSWKYSIEEGILDKESKRAILDFSNAHLSMNLKGDVEKLVHYLDSQVDYFYAYKFAIIMQKPHQVTIPFVVERMEKNFKSKTFYTKEAGMQWILK